MPSAERTRDHDEIRRWAEDRGGIPTIVKGTEGLLRIDFVEGPESGGRETSLEETSWEEWFRVFDDNDLVFLFSPQPDNKFFKLVRPSREEKKAPARSTGTSEPAEGNVVHVVHGEEGWDVEIEGSDRRPSHYRTKKDAVHQAREFARSHQPSHLVIHRSDGEVENRSSYGTARSRKPR